MTDMTLTPNEQSIVDRFREKFVFTETGMGDNGRPYIIGEELREETRVNDVINFLLQIDREAEQRGRDMAAEFISEEITKRGTYDMNYDDIYQAARTKK